MTGHWKTQEEEHNRKWSTILWREIWMTFTIVLPLLFILILLMACNGCSNWTYNGITRDDFRGGDFISIAAGFGTSYLVHTTGHIIAAEIAGEAWHYDGLSEIVDGELSPSEAQWFARAGFISQLSVGWIMRWCGADGPFARGYYTGTAFEIATYPVMIGFSTGGGDDLRMIDDNGGRSRMEWAGYTIAASGLMFKNKEGHTVE